RKFERNSGHATRNTNGPRIRWRSLRNRIAVGWAGASLRAQAHRFRSPSVGSGGPPLASSLRPTLRDACKSRHAAGLSHTLSRLPGSAIADTFACFVRKPRQFRDHVGVILRHIGRLADILIQIKQSELGLLLDVLHRAAALAAGLAIQRDETMRKMQFPLAA